MNKNQNTKEKNCAFYASDYHFEMISLPYIEKNLEENKQIVILTENDLQNTINVLIDRINLKEEKKEKILNLNWKNDDLNKLKQIKIQSEKGKEIIAFIKGKKNYIKNVNENIKNLVSNMKNLTIIDCYDIEEISEEIQQITPLYKNVLSTIGIKEL